MQFLENYRYSSRLPREVAITVARTFFCAMKSNCNNGMSFGDMFD